jgi:predicted nucleic acid-binding protein
MTMALSMDDEDVSNADQLLSRLARERALVPSLWLYEVANTLANAVRRGRLRNDQCASRLALILDLPVDVEAQESGGHSASILNLSLKHGLTAYDAAYLELAVRRDLPLATLDDPLADAARAEGVEVIGG